MDGKQIVAGYTALRTQRAVFQQTLDDIAFFCLPEYERKEKMGTDGTPIRPVTSKPAHSAQTCGGHMFANTISTGQQWFSLRSVRDNPNDAELQRWLHNSSQTALRAIQNSNFAEAYGSMITLYCTFGTGILGIDWDPAREQLVFRNLPVNRDAYLAENAYGYVDTIYRLLRYTASQAAQEFGMEALPEKIRQALRDPSKAAEKFEFVHMIAPNPSPDPNRQDWKGKPYVSMHVFRETEEIVRRSGFWKFPYACPRFIKTSEWPYGYGCGHRALYTIRQLNRGESELINALEMANHPPIFIPDEDALKWINLRPNSVNFMDFSQGKPWEYPVGGGNVQLLHQHVEQLKQELDELFFIDVFLSISMRYRKEKTATEVQALDEEKLSSIGPMVVRLQSECFSVMIERVVDLLMEYGMIDPPPESVNREGFRVVYTSRIDTKLAQVENMQFMRAVQDAANTLALGDQIPRLHRTVNLEEGVRAMLERSHINPGLIRSKVERQRMEREEAEAAAAAQAMEQERALVDKINPQAPIQEGSPLARLEQLQSQPLV